MASILEQLQEISSSLRPELHRFLKKVVQDITEKDEKIAKLQNEVYYLTTKLNELEHYSPKDSLIILNLPLLSSRSVVLC